MVLLRQGLERGVTEAGGPVGEAADVAVDCSIAGGIIT
jgi:hypothetical protein